MSKNIAPSTDDSRLLVTFALFAYNQEQFIREAVEGAFAQTYSPLEIILSDDCSSDRTFEIMQEMAAEYVGPHKVILNQNKRNLGIGGHINRVMELENGDLIVVAAGDDISCSHRVETLVNCWISNDCSADSLHSQVMRMTKEGKDTDIFKTRLCKHTCPEDFIKKCIIVGASHAWTKRLFERFGNLNTDIIREDRVIGFRASISGGVLFIDKPLVRYRDGGISQTDYKQLDTDPSKKILQAHIAILECIQNYKDCMRIDKNNIKILNSIRYSIGKNIASMIVATNSGKSSTLLFRNLFSFNVEFLKGIILKHAYFLYNFYKKISFHQ